MVPREANHANPVLRTSKLALLTKMGIGTSLFLIAAGAILRFAVTVSSTHFNVQTVGLILMIVGIVGLAISLLWITVWSDRRSRSSDVVERDVPPTQRYRY
jgi:sulfite exporter TauE/SafE